MASSSGSKTLTLVSSDGEHFEIPEAAGMLSGTLKNMVEDGCGDNPIPLANVSGKVLTKVVEYLKQQGGDGGGKKEVEEGLFSDDLNDLFECIMAANYMDIKGMLDVVAQKIADMIKDKSPEWVRTKFGIENDFTPEEETEIRHQNLWAYED